jgi:hypothetical protein
MPSGVSVRRGSAKNRTPEVLIRFWLGHADETVGTPTSVRTCSRTGTVTRPARERDTLRELGRQAAQNGISSSDLSSRSTCRDNA